MKRPPKDLAASVRQRLLDLSRTRKESFDAVLSRFGIERLLYRLACSPHRDAFVLKGAVLFTLWMGDPHRPTRDVDLLGRGASDIERMVDIFREICQQPVDPDGVVFDAKSVRGERIAEEQAYEGLRIRLTGTLAGARLALQVDIGFGDLVTPAPQPVQLPIVLDFPAPTLPVYPREAVVAEKFHAMVVLGIANSRMKDFFDIWTLAQTFEFAGGPLAAAIRGTFGRRRTEVPLNPPVALTSAFFSDHTKEIQWKAFQRKLGRSVGTPSLEEVVTGIREFLMPPISPLVDASDLEWPAKGPWRPCR